MASDIRGSTIAGQLVFAEPGDGAKVPKFRMAGYNGGAMRLEGKDFPVVIDLAGVVVASAQTPILYEHDPERPVGHAVSIEVSQSGILVTEGYFSGVGEWRDQALQAAKQGYPWQASIGGRAEWIDVFSESESVEVNGQTFAGPVGVARGFKLREISFVSIGADATTSVFLAASAARSMKEGSVMGFEEWCVSMGFDPSALTEQQRQSLQNEWQSKQANSQAEGEQPNPTKDGTYAEHEEPDGDEAPAKAGEPDEEAKKSEAKARGGRMKMSAGTQNIRASAAAELRRIDAIRKACGNHTDIAAKAIEGGWSQDKVELEVLRASRPRAVVPASRGSTAAGGPDRSAVIEAALLVRAGYKPEVLEAAEAKSYSDRYSKDVLHEAMARGNRGMTFAEIVHEYLACKGHHSRPGHLNDEDIRAALGFASQEISASSRQSGGAMQFDDGGFSTVSLPGILSNLLNKSLLASYIAVPTVSEKFCGAQDLNDFKTATRYRLTMNGTLSKVSATGEIKGTTFGEESWTNQLNTYGTLITLSRQTMINDDLDSFMYIPRQLGRQSALTVEELVFTNLLANANTSDGNAFFSAGHNNYKSGAGSALTTSPISSLTDAVTAFRKQTDSAGKPIVLTPRYLLVPPELMPVAEQIYKNQNLAVFNVTTGSAKLVPSENPFRNLYEPITSPYLSNAVISGYSTTAWYLLADPSDVPMMSVGYLRGQRTPTIDQGQTDLDILGFRWRCYFDIGVGMVDYRAGVLSAGA